MDRVELLSPAGGMDALLAAVENGADAVYLGGKSFSARQFAGNFDDGELVKAVEYCHIRGVKVYVTVNTLIKNDEMAELYKYITFLYNMGVDALIIQDIGTGMLINKMLPEFELHASTQVTAHNLDAVNFLHEKLGYKRIVLSRELTINEIRHITAGTSAEIEVFCHGALCICYSGQCLMSSMIGGRSGNRGRCAQPCRQRYTLKGFGNYEYNGYILSPKDLNTIDHIDEMIKSGVKSLKVEGRMKRPEYVAAVMSIYRKAIDSFYKNGNTGVTEEDKKELIKAFNRGGFTTAYLFEKSGKSMMSTERPKNWGIFMGTIINISNKQGTMEIKLEEELAKGDGIEVWVKSGENIGYTIEYIQFKGRKVDRIGGGNTVTVNYKGGKKGDKVYKTFDINMSKKYENTYAHEKMTKRIPLKCSVNIQNGMSSGITFIDIDGNSVQAAEAVPEKALKVPLTPEKLEEQVSKLGGTPFYIDSFDINLGNGLSLPLSALNSMRREAVDKLIDKRLRQYARERIPEENTKQISAEVLRKSKLIDTKRARISVNIRDILSIEAALSAGADIVVLRGDKLRGMNMDCKKAIEMCRNAGVEVYMSTPRIIRQEYKNVIEEIKSCLGFEINGIIAENMGVLRYVIDNSLSFGAGFSMNIFNYMSASVFKSFGADIISLSPELSLKEIRGISGYIENCEALCYGRIEMMVSEHCPICTEHSGICKNSHMCSGKYFYLKDRMGMEFPVRTDIYCRSHIYNSKILSMLENVGDVLESGVSILRLNMIDENPQEVFRIVNSFRKAADAVESGDMFDEYVMETIETIKEKGYTKGHYYRGVE